MKILEIGFKDGPSLEEGFLQLSVVESEFHRCEFESVEEFLSTQLEDITSFDLVAFFPACSVFSMMSVRHHWIKEVDSWGDSVLKPKSDKAAQSLDMLHKMDVLSRSAKLWFIENPAGTMHKQWEKGKFHRITHCQYGGGRMKPTNIWTSWNWISRPPCKYGDPCHPATPRGSRKSGTQTMKTKAERAKLPVELAVQLLVSAKIATLEKEFPL